MTHPASTVEPSRSGGAVLPVPVSLLDRSRTRQGAAPAAALLHTVERAQQAEELGYRRFWVAEHHAVPGIASGSPPVLMAAVAARTERIRVGSGGVMLPNHRPVVVAEQVRMLQALHPDRIDLGVGRSLGFTAPVRRALGVTRYDLEQFAADLTALQDFLTDSGPVTVMPDGVPPPPVFVLATGRGLPVAAERGLPVVVGGPALHGDLTGLEAYRQAFRPSPACPEPQVVVSLDVMIAETTERARELLLPEAWAMAESRTSGAFPALRPEPVAPLTARQQTVVDRQLELAVHGTAPEVLDRLGRLVERTGAAEVLASTSTYDRSALADADAALGALAATCG